MLLTLNRSTTAELRLASCRAGGSGSKATDGNPGFLVICRNHPQEPGGELALPPGTGQAVAPYDEAGEGFWPPRSGQHFGADCQDPIGVKD